MYKALAYAVLVLLYAQVSYAQGGFIDTDPLNIGPGPKMYVPMYGGYGGYIEQGNMLIPIPGTGMDYSRPHDFSYDGYSYSRSRPQPSFEQEQFQREYLDNQQKQMQQLRDVEDQLYIDQQERAEFMEALDWKLYSHRRAIACQVDKACREEMAASAKKRREEREILKMQQETRKLEQETAEVNKEIERLKEQVEQKREQGLDYETRAEHVLLKLLSPKVTQECSADGVYCIESTK